jgi:riboflavin synthase
VFTGIVAAVGRIAGVERLGADGGVRLHVEAPGLDLADVSIGDSIAVQGACLTAVAVDGNRFTVEVSRETLARTVGLDGPGEVNLEKALRLSDRLGGHLVSGHVDGLGEVIGYEPVGESWRLDILVPRELSRFFAFKGSVTVDGVSLTVNRVEDRPGGAAISINLIPHTVAVTTLKRLAVGDRVNLEVDLIARYVERLMRDGSMPDGPPAAGG